MKTSIVTASERSHLVPHIFRLGIALFVLICAAAFIELATDVWAREAFAWDTPLTLTLHSLSRPWLNQAMLWVSNALTPATVLVGIAFFLSAKWHDAAALFISGAGATIIEVTGKVIFARPRPQLFPPLMVETSFSFPSGHMLIAVGVFGFVAARLWMKQRRLVAALCAVFILLIGISRVYLGVHYPSDVLASLLLGMVWVVGVMANLVAFTRAITKTAIASSNNIN